MNIQINPEIRPFPGQFEPKTSDLVTKTISVRIINTALPFLMLVPGVTQAYSAVDGVKNICDNSKKAKRFYGERNYKQMAGHACTSLIYIQCIALMTVHPLGYLIGVHTFDMLQRSIEVVSSLKMGDHRKTHSCGIKALRDGIYLAATLIGGPELLFLTLFAQAIFELNVARECFSKGLQIEGIGALFLFILRTVSAIPFAEKARFNFNCVKITTNELMGKINEKRSTPVSINWCDLSGQELCDTKLEDIRFNNCRFDDANFKGVQMTDVFFKDCEFIGVKFYECALNRVWWLHSNLTDASFRLSKLANCVFSMSYLNGVDFRAAWIKCSSLLQCNITNTQFEEGKNPFRTLYPTGEHC